MKKIIAKHKWVAGCVVTEMLDTKTDKRYFVAKIKDWNNFYFPAHPIMSADDVAKEVRGIRDKIEKGDLTPLENPKYFKENVFKKVFNNNIKFKTMTKKQIEAMKRIIASPNQSENAKRIAKETLAKYEKENKGKKEDKPKQKRRLPEWRQKAKSLGIKYAFRKKADVLADIAEKEGKGVKYETPKKDSKPETKKSETTEISESAKEITLKGGHTLKKYPNGWIARTSKGTGTIKKENGAWNVYLTHETKGFKTFKEAVKHLETELYQGVLKDMIDEKIEAKAKAKERAKNPVKVDKTLKNAAEAVKNKTEKGVTKTEADNSVDDIVDITESIKNGLKSKKNKIDFLKTLLKTIQRMIKDLEK